MKKTVIYFSVLFVFCVAVYFYCFPVVVGSFESPIASPDGRYEIRFHRAFSFIRVFKHSLGLGDWGAVPGYVELYDKENEISLGKKFATNLLSQEPRWYEDEVTLPPPVDGWKLEVGRARPAESR